jgi:hypothetical protein
MSKEEEPKYITGHPGYRRRPYDPTPPARELEETKPDNRPLIPLALAVSLALNLGNCYGLLTERQQRIERDQQLTEYSNDLVKGLNELQMKVQRIRR